MSGELTSVEHAGNKIVELYKYESGGGLFHVAIDDGNWGCLESCWSDAQEEARPYLLETYRQCYEALEPLSEEERCEAASLAFKTLRYMER